MSEYKVLFHIDEFDKWDLLLKDVGILLDAVDIEKYYIEVLATSEAVTFYNIKEISEENFNALKCLNDRGIKFVACNDALRSHDIKQEDIINFGNIIPMGTLELINRQNEGYIYLKAW